MDGLFELSQVHNTGGGRLLSRRTADFMLGRLMVESLAVHDPMLIFRYEFPATLNNIARGAQ
jgi:hypothetical protein